MFSLSRYQHVGIGNTKLWRSKPTPVPNVNGFVSQWNIGLKGTNMQHSGHMGQNISN